MASGESLAKGLATFLAETWGEPVEVGEIRVASAGARRRNVLFDATVAGVSRPGVVTIVPSAAVQVMDVELEAGSLRFAEAAGVPVPHVYGVCRDPALLGGPFFVTARVEGETIPRRVLRALEAQPALAPTLGRQCGTALARLHARDPKELAAALQPAGRASPAEQALALLDPLFADLLQPSPAFRLGLRWLVDHCPAPPPRLALVHGDFRNGNLIVSEAGLQAVLDWEVSHVGDPMEDLGWLCQRMWRFRSDAREVGGFADRSALRAGYESAGGTWDEARFRWWKVMGTLRWGLGLAGQAAAHIRGVVPSIVMAASGRRVAELEYDVLMLIRSAYEGA